jgi:hypothetical protein
MQASHKYFFEIRQTVQRMSREVHLFAGDELENKYGFVSVYGFDAALTALIRDRQSTRDLKDFPVYSETLYVDFDSNDGLDEFLAALRDEHYTYELWSTGNRGAHVHIPIVPMYGKTVPDSQREWVLSIATPTAAVDTTIYRHAAMIRLPDTFSEKNAGHSKHLINRHVGSRKAEIPLLPPRPPVSLPSLDSGEPADRAVFYAMYQCSQGEPGRRNFIWRFGATAAEAGIPLDEALDAAMAWGARRCDPPLPPAVVEEHFTSGYRKGLTHVS